MTGFVVDTTRLLSSSACGGDFHGIKIGIETILSLQVSAAFFNLLSSSSFTRTTGTPRGGVGRFGDGSRDHRRF